MSELLRDARNVELLRLLRDDPRMSVSALARRVGMSAPAVRERIQRLEEAGIIKGYRLDIDARALGYPIAAFVRIRPMPGQLAKIAELAQSMPQIVECDRITGEDCFILKIYLEILSGPAPLPAVARRGSRLIRRARSLPKRNAAAFRFVFHAGIKVVLSGRR